jgi:hypothetical protein
MSTTFTLGLDILPGKLVQGMDERSSAICDLMHRELGFPGFEPTTRGSVAWTSKKAGVIATVRYAEDRLAQAFESLSGIAGRLFISLDPSKQVDREEALANIFATAKHILDRIECDAAFILDWEHVILRRAHGEVSVEEISHLFPRGDSGALLKQLTPIQPM